MIGACDKCGCALEECECPDPAEPIPLPVRRADVLSDAIAKRIKALEADRDKWRKKYERLVAHYTKRVGRVPPIRY